METEGGQDTDANLASQAGKGDSNAKTQETSWSGQTVDTVHHLDDDAVVEVYVQARLPKHLGQREPLGRGRKRKSRQHEK